MSDLNETERRIGELLIGSIDDSGYLTTSLQDLAIASGLEETDIERGLRVVQSFDPVGVGARDLRECLLLQLDRLGKSDSLAARVVAGHLEALGKKRYPEIARALGVNVSQVQQAANLIATLEPKPGRIFGAEPDHYVVPDVVVRKVDDEYVVILNDEQVPHLRISRQYRRLMSNQDGDEKTREYVRDKIRSGKFLIKSIYQRQRTIENIAREIVLHQRDFLDNGVGSLKPLTMAQIADRVGVHETTVSRAIANKYIETPQGIFEMKFFFSPGYTTESGQEMSNVAVKENIADLVAREDPTHPLSDQEIVEILKEQGVSIARRTVAKYRQELSILPSNLRRQY
jgi:RNA polymerase sigma-54 factor